MGRGEIPWWRVSGKRRNHTISNLSPEDVIGIRVRGTEISVTTLTAVAMSEGVRDAGVVIFFFLPYPSFQRRLFHVP
jgi:hypothetical protein